MTLACRSDRPREQTAHTVHAALIAPTPRCGRRGRHRPDARRRGAAQLGGCRRGCRATPVGARRRLDSGRTAAGMRRPSDWRFGSRCTNNARCGCANRAPADAAGGVRSCALLLRSAPRGDGAERSYHTASKMAFHNALHGFGVLCGCAGEAEAARRHGEHRRASRWGAAIDSCGRGSSSASISHRRRCVVRRTKTADSGLTADHEHASLRFGPRMSSDPSPDPAAATTAAASSAGCAKASWRCSRQTKCARPLRFRRCPSRRPGQRWIRPRRSGAAFTAEHPTLVARAVRRAATISGLSWRRST